jgi:hypothetical protein
LSLGLELPRAKHLKDEHATADSKVVTERARTKRHAITQTEQHLCSSLIFFHFQILGRRRREPEAAIKKSTVHSAVNEHRTALVTISKAPPSTFTFHHVEGFPHLRRMTSGLSGSI